ncbi:MAG: hypothetical protein OXF20_14635 [Gammaproteobacteria bacterium]|nr:hypothetical protein [Gammaproteobacteria bacterium]
MLSACPSGRVRRTPGPVEILFPIPTRKTALNQWIADRVHEDKPCEKDRHCQNPERHESVFYNDRKIIQAETACWTSTFPTSEPEAQQCPDVALTDMHEESAEWPRKDAASMQVLSETSTLDVSQSEK